MPASARRDAARMMSGRGRSVDVGVPAWVVAVAAVGAGFVLVPLIAMVSRVDWAEFVPLITSESSLDALGLSLRTSLAATASFRVPTVRSAPSRLRTRKGSATKVCASTTAVVENAIVTPIASNVCPRRPRRPNV